MHIIRQIWF